MSVIGSVSSRFWIVGPKARAAGCADGSLTRFALSALLSWSCFNRLIRRFTGLWWQTVLLLCGRLLFWRSRLLFRRRRFLYGRGGFLIGGLVSFEEILALKRENDLSRSSQPDWHAAAGR